MRVRLLGDFELRPSEGEPLRLDSTRAESLLGYLALHAGIPQPRQVLAALLWPDSTEGQARTNLRHLLHTLRQSVEVGHLLDISARTVALRPGIRVELDVTRFESALDRAEMASGAAEVAALTDAVDSYRGDLLPGCYDDWPVAERDRLRARFTDALEQLGACLADQGDHAAAVRYLERLVQEDPLRESAYRRLIESYGERGELARAVRTYHGCASTLERELGIEPSSATRAAYAALLPAEPESGDRSGEPALVGRAPERRQLTREWQATASGPARMVLLTGEPGLGKSRLAEAFGGWCARQGAIVATAAAHAAEGELAFAPVVSWLRSPGIRAALAGLSTAQHVELARLLPELAEAGTPQLLPAEEQRHRLFDAVARLLRAAGPVVLVADDLHWFDRESLGLLHYLVRGGGGARLLVVATARPGDASPRLREVLARLRALGRLTELDLPPLTPTETEALAVRVSRGFLAGDELARLHAETEGNPLFVVESLRAGWPANRTLSPRVHAVIESRLTQLSATGQDVLDVAASIGREFTTDLLTAASDRSADDVVAGLDELWARRIVREHGSEGYDFSHGKIREVAYGAISPPRRARLHHRIADALARAGEQTPDPLCGLIAHHYQRAGAVTASVPWALRAAEAAARLHANADAVALLNQTLRLLRTVPASRETKRLELRLLTALPGPLCAVHAYAAPEVSEVQRRAVALADELGAALEPPLVRSLALSCLTRSDFDGAQRHGEQLLRRGQQEHDDVLVVEGAYVLGIAAFWRARFPSARKFFELAIRRYRPDHRAIHLVRYGQDPRVVCASRLANTLWFLGEPAAARRASDTALALAESTGHPYSRTVALIFAATLALDAADEPRFRELMGQLTTTDDESTQNRLAIGSLRAYLDVLDGRIEDGLAQLHAFIASHADAQPAPGLRACLQRILLAAAVAAGDVAVADTAAETLLTMGGGAAIWRGEALRVRDSLAVRNR